MDAQAALDRLRDISSQVRAAVVAERSGAVLGSTVDDERRAGRIRALAQELLADAERRRPGVEGEFAQLEVATPDGSVFVVSHGERLIAATTPADPTVGLVFYDLKSCLRELEDDAAPAKKPTAKRPPAKKQPAAKKPAAKKPPAKKPPPKKPDAKP